MTVITVMQNKEIWLKYIVCTFDSKSISFIVTVVVSMASDMDQICFYFLSHIYNVLKNFLVFDFFSFWILPFSTRSSLFYSSIKGRVIDRAFQYFF